MANSVFIKDVPDSLKEFEAGVVEGAGEEGRGISLSGFQKFANKVRCLKLERTNATHYLLNFHLFTNLIQLLITNS